MFFLSSHYSFPYYRKPFAYMPEYMPHQADTQYRVQISDIGVAIAPSGNKFESTHGQEQTLLIKVRTFTRDANVEWTVTAGNDIFLSFGNVNLEQSFVAETKFINVASPWIGDMTMIIALVTTVCAMHYLVCFIVRFYKRKRATSRHRKDAFDEKCEHSCLEVVTVNPREPCSDVESKVNCIPSGTEEYTNEEVATIDKDFLTKRVEVDPTLYVLLENYNTGILMWTNNTKNFGIIGATNNIIESENNMLVLCTYNGSVRENWTSKDGQFISHDEFVSSMLADNDEDITPKEISAQNNKDEKLLMDQQNSTKDVVAKVPSSRKTNGSCWDMEPQPYQPKFKLHYATDSDERPTLTQMPDFYRALEENEDEAFDELGRQTLFADTYVKSVGCLPKEEQLRLLGFIERSPAQVTGTRWKVHAVLNEYLSLSWYLEDNTWTFDFTLVEFETQCQNYFGEISPVDALNASILAFLKEPSLYFS
ncbi:hypothetical protein BC937DRAFT_95117 [Endogone sp. FLAS-F59071]|nr:hypothetical protein BC937DRAFT_95117 [Endogone sp. FLAS-F59071]|eukprot:RUS20482.1 hypothetical protein BC937DRAFT_95117 [Endogone sp. FLAS-F59071]